MPPQFALVVFATFVLWLLANDRKERKAVSDAIWLPVLWLLIVGSRPMSAWFGFGGDDTPEGDLEGSPFDRAFFLSLIVAGAFVLAQRRARLRHFGICNKWLLAYFIYLGLSTLWSDYPFTSFKRWIKDGGNLVLVLVVLTEQNPGEAFRAVLARTTYVLVPMSVVLVKYFPALSRYYDQWTFQPSFCGVTTNKNLLGMTLFVCGSFLVWRLSEQGRLRDWAKKKTVVGTSLFLILMTVWLLDKSQSSTASTCTLVCVGLLCAFRFQSFRRKAKHIGFYSCAIVGGLLLLHAFFNLGDIFVRIVGRDLTFTGRTEIWKLVLKEDVNPLLGAGFYSFWLGDRSERLSREYFYHLNQAHNGYIETYLNSGWVGVSLLAVLMLSSARQMSQDATRGSGLAVFRLSFLAALLLYNFTEATFDRLNLIWFTLLLSLASGTGWLGRSNRGLPPQAVGGAQSGGPSYAGKSAGMRSHRKAALASPLSAAYATC